jgi:hypothetical protein
MKLADGRIEIVTRDGRVFERVGDNVPGSTEVPTTWDQVAAKFSDCAACSTVPLSPAKISRAQEMARNLESLDNATVLMRAMA